MHITTARRYTKLLFYRKRLEPKSLEHYCVSNDAPSSFMAARLARDRIDVAMSLVIARLADLLAALAGAAALSSLEEVTGLSLNLSGGLTRNGGGGGQADEQGCDESRGAHFGALCAA
jgi:hypothetical protein